MVDLSSLFCVQGIFTRGTGNWLCCQIDPLRNAVTFQPFSGRDLAPKPLLGYGHTANNAEK